tara:strand:- start:169 stop:474 length:306 start_codon:yes stop_codon:yes gene_type:complete
MSDRSIVIRKFENEVATYSDYLSETSNQIMYREYITPKEGKEIIPGMEYEEYVDIDKKNLNGVTFDQIHDLLKNTKPENRIDDLKKFLKSNNVSYEAGLWN